MSKAAPRRFRVKLKVNFLQSLGRPFFQLLVFFLSGLFLFILVIQSIKLPQINISPLPPLKLRGGSKGVLLVTSIIIAISFFYWQILYHLPSAKDLARQPQKLTTQILDRNGQLLYKIYDDENRTRVKITDLPLPVREAFLAIEDNNFYHHLGFSPFGILRAFINNFICQLRSKNCQLSGGSTITQQLVKNVLLTRERTWTRKIKELILALEAENLYDKNTLFEMYLNQVGFGGTAYGIEAGSEQYFGINASDLSVTQAAFLAGLPKAPSKFSPYENPQLALERTKLVLTQMFKDHYLNANELQSALNTPLKFNPDKTQIKAPHFVMYIRDLLTKELGEDLVNHGGLTVTTSLDLKLQEMTEGVLNDELEKIKTLNVTNGAILITKPKTGEILAMIGSKNYFATENDGQVNLTTSLRQPGSAIKPVNYALALENGLSPNTFIDDEPVSFNIVGSGLWTPKNYDGRFHGLITIRAALANSYNIPAIILLARGGVDNMVSLGQKMGITTWNDQKTYGLALTLGSAEVKMTDMAVVYGTLANQGLTVPLNPILKVIDSAGNTVQLTSPAPHYSLKPETAFILTDILSDNQARSAAFGYNSVLNLKKYAAAVKTGTSNDMRDNWTIGYTPDFLVASWVGNNDNSSMSRIASGITGASPIWAKIITNLLDENPHNTAFAPPGNLLHLPICTITGTLTCTGCPTHYEYFQKGTEPKTACNPDDIQKILDQRSKTQASLP